MLSEEELKQKWALLEDKLATQLGRQPLMDDVLFWLGLKEAGLPPRNFSEAEKVNIIQMAECTVLVPARYYQLYWVEDSGWPHYTQLQRLPHMSATEKTAFLQPYVIMYAEKHKMLV